MLLKQAIKKTVIWLFNFKNFGSHGKCCKEKVLQENFWGR